jgi:hypothetical protein
MDADAFRVQGHRLVEWIASFFEHLEGIRSWLR